MIREATPADFPRVLEMAQAHHALMTGLPPLVEADFLASATVAVESPDAIILLSDGGSICGAVQPFYFNAGAHHGLEIWWHASDGSGADLLEAFEAWARGRGATRCIMSADANHRSAAIERVLSRRGYRRMHVGLVKEF